MSEISTGTLISSLETGCPDNITVKAIRAALLERDALKSEVERLKETLTEWEAWANRTEKLIADRTKQAEKAEAEVAKLKKDVERWKTFHANAIKIGADFVRMAKAEAEAAANQNAAKLATEVNNLKASSTFQAYEEIRLRLHDALRELDEWRDKAMEKRRRIGCECPNCHAQLSVMGVVVADEEGK